ncbi:MAG: sigma-70 family RNA polymerase sigma factor [Flavobacteriales bacterium]|nr:sigma-70 family RNA polymerase sigma factor [Flavobacteriales bacterium]
MTDQEILELFRTPEKREVAFGHLLAQHQKQVYYYIRRMVLSHDDADDITQNTFIKAWKALGDFRGDSKISTWLHRIAYNESINFIHSSKKVHKVAIDDAERSLGSALQDDELYHGDEIQRKLQTALALLPEKQKAVFIMKYYEEKKYEEIAEITGTSVGALKASYHHAVSKIESYLMGGH